MGYLEKARYKLYPTSNVRIYLYSGTVNPSKMPKNLILYDMAEKAQIKSTGSGVPPENYSLKVNRFTLLDTNLCMCRAKKLGEKSDNDYAVAFSNVGADDTPVRMVLEIYETLSNPDPEYRANTLLNNAGNLLKEAKGAAESLNAKTFVTWASS